MRAYIITTGVIFALITIAHIARLASESHVLKEPIFLVLTVLAAVLTVWSVIVLRRVSH
ncbi:MAG TPA: hypothetical protein VGJ37_16510 [Pyrinomonadaceae bacterium]|jgi:hypothetical protein